MWVVSWNVNGLRDLVKLKSVFTTAKDCHADIICLQETFWDNDFIDMYSHLWDGHIIYNNCPYDNRKGVAMLISKKCTYVSNVKYRDEHGRVLKVSFGNGDTEFDVFNVYLPNKYLDRITIWKSLSPLVLNENTIFAGDINDILDPSLDKSATVKSFCLQGCEFLHMFLNKHNLCDVWRYLNPDKREYSRQQFVEGSLKQSRIDMFLITRNILVNVTNCFIKYTTLSDHNMLLLKLDFHRVERGPGVWIFNNTLLDDPKFCIKVRSFVEEDVKCPLYDLEPLMWWDNLKSKLKRISMYFAKNKCKSERNVYYDLQNSLRREYDKSSKYVTYDHSKIHDLENKLQEYELQRCRGAILRSKAQWALESDRCTSFFLNLEKSKQEHNSIKALNSDTGCASSTKDILDCCYNYYSSLYSEEVINMSDQDKLLDLLDVRLNEEDVDTCDKPITSDELTVALKGMKCKKSPGVDGLTVEFYRAFWDLFNPLLLKVSLCIQESNELSRTMKKGIISLFYKKKGDRLNLKNYRPISLLCVDYKLFSRVLALRLKQVLPKIISPEQSSTITGRTIYDNILSVSGTIDFVEESGDEAYLVKIDQEKAFDRVSHKFIVRVLERFNFGKTFISLVELLYSGIISSVKCNGHLSQYFPLTRSVRQGCPISPMLYCLVAEPLNRLLTRNLSGSCVTISSSCRSLLYQHADDTTVTVNNLNAVYETFSSLNLYCSGSGSKVNLEKSEVLLLGSAKEKYHQLNIPVQVKRDAVEVLGIFLGPDKKVCQSLNWTRKVSNIKSLLGLWSCRKLTLQGRSVVLNSLIVSRLWYLVYVQPVPYVVENDLNLAFKNFLWPNKCISIKSCTTVGKRSEGGLNVPNIGLKMCAMRLKVIKKLNDPDFDVVWKHTVLHFLSLYGKMGLNANVFSILYDKNLMGQLPLFYRELLVSWDKFNAQNRYDPTELNEILQQPLCFNPHICFSGKVLNFDFFFMAGIKTVADICYEVLPKFLSHQSIVEIVSDVFPDKSVSIVKNAYTVLLYALPLQWRKLILSQTVHSKIPVGIKCALDVVSVLPVEEFSVKLCYEHLVKQVFLPPTSYDKWNEIALNFEWPIVWENICCNDKPSECAELDFKIAHRTIFTQEKLFKIGKVVSDLCPVCGTETEDLMHLFVFCSELESAISTIKIIFEDVCRETGYTFSELSSWLLLGFQPRSKLACKLLIDLMLSSYRLAVFKRRTVAQLQGKTINISRLFQSIFKSHISFVSLQYKKQKRFISFMRKYIMCTSYVTLDGDDNVLQPPFE